MKVFCALALVSFVQNVENTAAATPFLAFSAQTSREPIITNESNPSTGSPAVCRYFEVKIPTSQEGPPRQAISVEDLTPTIKSLLKDSGMRFGSINVISRHTTTAITINERESRLAQDMEKYFLSLAPPDERSTAVSAKKGVRYFHNDIDQRPDSAEEAERCRENGWDIDDPTELQKWRDQEPINSHSHLLSMLLGSSETIPVVDSNMVIGQVRRHKYYFNIPGRFFTKK
jgi:thiamine phosphate synthase YjbQ (UPF0047 family)